MKLPWVRIKAGRPETEIVIAGVRLTATPRQISCLPLVSAFVQDGLLEFVPDPQELAAGPVPQAKAVRNAAARRTTMEG